MKTVVAALIKKDGKYLLAKRSTGNPDLVGFWEFPGGKVEDGETDEAALEREIIEEFNTVIKVDKLKATAMINDDTTIKLYECTHELGAYQLRDHSEIVWLDSLDKMYGYDLAPPDLELLDQINPSTRKPQLAELEKGHEYQNADLMRIFCVSGQGGIRKSIKANCLVIVAKHDDSNPYDDKWVDGKLEYTGMGLDGDQSIDYMYNKDLAESNTNGLDLYLFESFESNSYFYCGKVKLDGEPYFETQKDKFGKDRKVVKFSLRLID